jgi:hypothetical protein
MREAEAAVAASADAGEGGCGARCRGGGVAGYCCGVGACEAGLGALVGGPVEESGDQLEDLELFRVGAVEVQEVEEVVCYDLAVKRVGFSYVFVCMGG